MIISMKMAVIGGIVIVAIVGITVGIVFATKGGDGNSCEGFSAPVNLKFEDADDKLYIKWSSPDNVGDCTAKYKLVLTVNDEERNPVEIEGLQYEITDVEICAKLIATVSTIDKNGDESNKATAEHTVDVGDISDVVVKDLTPDFNNDVWTIQWTKLSGYGNCEIKYLVMLNDVTQGVPIPESTTTISNNDFIKCSNNEISVLPVIQDKNGGKASIQVNGELGDISEVTVGDLSAEISDNVWTVQWSEPSGYSACDIKYNVYLEDAELEETIAEKTATISNDDLKRCADNVVGVMPVINNNNAKLDSIKIKGDVGDVSNVAVDNLTSKLNGDIWQIRWAAPNLYEDCDVKYLVYLGGKPQEGPISEVTTTIKNSDLTKCANNELSVKPQIDGEDGKEAKIQIKGDIGDVSKVTVTEINSDLNANIWTITWTKPSGYDSCDVKYIVSQGGNAGEPISAETTQISNNLLTKCANNDIGIKPVIESQHGQEVKEVVKGDVGDVSTVTVTEITSVLNANSWTITWTKPSGYDSCDVKYIVSQGGNAGDPISGETTNISNDLLTKCADNDIGVKPVIENQHGQDAKIVIKGEPELSNRVTEGKIEVHPSDLVKVAWKKVAELETCSFKYNLELLKDGVPIGTVENHDTENWETTVADVATCEGVTATITAVYESPGEPLIVEDCTAVPEVVKYYRGRAVNVNH